MLRRSGLLRRRRIFPASNAVFSRSLSAGAVADGWCGLVSECRFDAEVPFAKGGMSICRRDSVFHVDQEALYSAAMRNVTCKQKNIRFTY